MPRLLALILFALAPYLVFTQSFSIEPNPVNVEIDLNTSGPQFEIQAQATITNNTDEVLNIKWVRLINDKPDCWLTNVFDPWVSYLPFVDSAAFELDPGVSSNLYVSAYIGLEGTDYAGQAQVVLEVRDLNNPNEPVLVEYNIVVLGDNSCVTSVSEIDRDNLQVYPNPTASSFQLKHAQDVHALNIYNSLGEEVKHFHSKGEAYDISNLKKGLYALRLYDGNGELIKTVKLLKD